MLNIDNNSNVEIVVHTFEYNVYINKITRLVIVTYTYIMQINEYISM